MDPSHVRNLPLAALRAFDAVSRNGSIKAAAAELSVTPAAVSQQVRALERLFGASLFHRLHRYLAHTHTGERLALTTRRAFGDLARELARMQADGLIAGRTTLNISAAPSFGAKWLAPRLHLFEKQHAQVEVRLDAENRRVDLARDADADITLRYGPEHREPAVHAERIWPSGVVLAVCAPSLLDEKLKCPRDLLRHSLLRTADPLRGAVGERIGWLAWLAAAKITGTEAETAAQRSALFGSTQLALEAATAGRGIALAPAVLAFEDLRAGRLIQPIAITIPDPYAYWLSYRKDRANEAKIRAFATWLRRAAGTLSTPG